MSQKGTRVDDSTAGDVALDQLRGWAVRQQLAAAACPGAWLVLVDYLPVRQDGELWLLPSQARAEVEAQRWRVVDPDAAVVVSQAGRYCRVLEEQMRWLEAASAAAARR
jgi:hypothetical protein